MPKSNPQPGFAPQLPAEFQEKLWAALPFLEWAVALAHKLIAEVDRARTDGSCISCPKRECCKQPCDQPEAYMDGPYRGKLHGETSMGTNFVEIGAQNIPAGQEDGEEQTTKKDCGTFRDFKKVEPFDAIEPYKPCWDLLTQKQQDVVRLFHGDGKGLTEVAVILGKAPSSVRGLLDRAQAIKDKHRAEMRKKDLEILREQETKRYEE